MEKKQVRRRGRSLKTRADCHRFLQFIANETLADRMKAEKASKLRYIVDGILRILEHNDLDKMKDEVRELQDLMEGEGYG
jgi:hypothetical protein